ncbi:sugar transferase [Aestuariispira insulae]|uniref:Lipopolysaccharide/colanic/teichoic acid biosynthesis glycosyltransferase n=1 Tax=Aestuariispira insulae TaxID=1461337 RepID=A0A3D9H2Q6_9PROT|nr:sugar transferase [Aestuariispira insulae]RED43797.1 lipopolysaccharide/colanic/teichoic acid biosynthesis glycosyltransferase [Aestuariispira insulae]
MTVLLLILIALVLYHHVFYPMMMIGLSVLKRKQGSPADEIRQELPTVHIVIPACNEARQIGRKISSLAGLNYPREKLAVTILDDGSNDSTIRTAKQALREASSLKVAIIPGVRNLGKVNRLNMFLPTVQEDITVMTDASAILSRDSLRTMANHFANPSVQVVAGGYGLPEEAGFAQKVYWKLQQAIKRGENALGALCGAHGAFYGIRSGLFRPLPDGTINDDFVIPMQILLEEGGLAVYDPDIAIQENAVDSEKQDMGRRVRIGAGNLQQITLLSQPLLGNLFSSHGFCFLSGKILRVLMGPAFLALALLLPVAALADPVWLVPCLLFWLGVTIAALAETLPGPVGAIARMGRYLLLGHWCSMIGALQFGRLGHQGWTKTKWIDLQGGNLAQPLTCRLKRMVDFLIALVSLVLLLPLFPMIALAIKLTSPGPVIFAQERIGRALPDRTEIFKMYKFRSMHQDAEKGGKPVWAQQKDPRVTTIGRFLRKTRLDELPQLINVLKGDMSLIGPRPERPGFYQQLDREIPFFADRTYWVRPGITGLAQTVQGYTETVEEARTKALYDHVYALKTHRVSDWLRTDCQIVWDTIAVMALGRGR